MKLISLDLELNQPSQKVIQVGACVYDLKKDKITEKFCVFVNPYETLNPEIIELTGITQNQVDNESYSVKEAYFLLKKFAKDNQTYINSLLWGSGTWNDSSHLYKEADPGEPNFSGHRVLDVKTLYQMYRIINFKRVKGGLATACEELGLSFEGKNHNALDDAINTARVFSKLVKLLKIDPKTQKLPFP